MNARDELDRGQESGDILLFMRPKGMSRIISWLTRSPYYHVAICDDTFHVIESRPRGVVRRDLRSREGGHGFIGIPSPNAAGLLALEWAKGRLGDKYDGLAAISSVFDRIFRHLHVNLKSPGNEFTCGELVARAFLAAGVNLFPDLDPKDVLPRDFARLLPAAGAAHLTETRAV